MSVYRTYFTKDNTIIKNKYTNTGLNPVLGIGYGSSEKIFSRSIFSFDIENIKERIENKRINGNIKHTLNLVNTVAYDKTNLQYLNKFQSDHASSFDLILFKVPEFWDEGVGYDYDFSNILIDMGGNIIETPSNYYKRSGNTDWSEKGIYSGSTSSQLDIIETIHFDLGNENIKVDLTEFVNDLIENGTDDFYGLGLAFKPEFEELVTQTLYTVHFYGKDTHTFFEPYIETTWDGVVEDDRNNFYYDKENKLYLYTNINKNPINLDEIPSLVTIYDYNDEELFTIDEINHEGLGIYSVNFELDSENFDKLTLVNFTDIWSGLKYQGKILPEVEMTFTVKQNNYFNLGNEIFEPQEFAFNFTGIRRGEKIDKGEVRKVIVTVKEFFNNDSLILDNIYYNCYVKQGNSKVIVIPKTQISRGFNQNYFYLDTSWMITQEYVLEIIVDSNGTIRKKDDITFTIVDGLTDNLTGAIQVN